MPIFFEWSLDGAKDYTSVFGGFGIEPLVRLEDVPEFSKLLDLVYADADLSQAFDVRSPREAAMNSIWLRSFVEQLVSRLLSLTQPEDAFLPEYIRLEEGVLGNDLAVDIGVPILNVQFGASVQDCDVLIEKMSDPLQLARIHDEHQTQTVGARVRGAATHMLRLLHYSVPNWGRFEPDPLIDASRYPLDRIEAFFAALRLSQGVDTGYAQLLGIPKGWAKHYTSDLPPVHVATLRGFTSHLEESLPKDIKIIGKDGALRTLRLAKELFECERETMHIAWRRMNRAYLRTAEDDSLIDAVVGLEALLVGGERGSLRYKVTLRGAALLQAVGGDDAAKVRQNLGRVYTRRSEMVHAKRQIPDARRLVASPEQKSFEVRVAIDYLGRIILALLEQPQFQDPTRIDKELLLGQPWL